MKKTILSGSLQRMFSSSMVLGLGMLSAPVFAQQSENLEKPQRVEITGSSIRRVDAETPSPIQVISAEDLKKSGYSSISQVLQNITANGQGTLSQSMQGAFC